MTIIVVAGTLRACGVMVCDNASWCQRAASRTECHRRGRHWCRKCVAAVHRGLCSADALSRRSLAPSDSRRAKLASSASPPPSPVGIAPRNAHERAMSRRAAGLAGCFACGRVADVCCQRRLKVCVPCLRDVLRLMAVRAGAGGLPFCCMQVGTVSRICLGTAVHVMALRRSLCNFWLVAALPWPAGPPLISHVTAATIAVRIECAPCVMRRAT